MIVRGRNGEMELVGDLLIVRSFKGLLRSAKEKRFPISKIIGINFKASSLLSGYLHFDTGSAFDGSAFAALNGEGGITFDSRQESAFLQFRDEVERRMAKLGLLGRI